MPNRVSGAVTIAILLLVSLVDGVPVTSLPSDNGPNSADCMLQWLLTIGVDQSSAEAYSVHFKDERVDGRVLRNLTLEQLSVIGVSRLGHRLLIHNCLRNQAGDGCGHTACRNGGSCHYTSAVDSFRCSCPSGVNGDLCENVVDWCMAYPCLNGGTCTTERKDGGQVACVCPSGLTGDRCELDHCHSNPCQNGGRCTPLPDGYECSCSTGYDGSNCETASAQDKDLREQISLLSAQVHFLNQTIGYRVDKAVVTVYDTMLSAQGPRFFREYLEIDHHSITQVKHFRMGSQRYLAAVNTNSRHRHYGIIIYELLDDDTLVHIQTISDPNRPLNIAIKPFSIGGEYFIASANDFNLNSESVNSKLYRWERNRFNLMQTFGTNGSKDVDFISIPNVGSFLAFACYRNSRSFATTSRILFWQPTTSRFISFRKLETTGARKIHFSVANGETYITVASEYDESHHGHSNSSVYRFDFKTGEFLLFQHIPTYRAWDLRLFAVGCQTFLVAANYYNNSSHNTMSVMYRLEKGRFVEHAVLPTKGVVAVEPITIQTENFLAVANSHDEQSAGAKTASMIYKLDGPNVVPFQEIPTRKASHIHSFTTKDGCTALVIADRVGRSKLYKWTRVSVDKSSCCV